MSDSTVKHGQQYDAETGLVRRYTEQDVDYDGDDDARISGFEGNAGVELTPIDRGAAKARTYNLTAIQAAKDAFVRKQPGKTNLPLPDVLISVTITYNKGAGTGVSAHPASQMGYTTAGTSISGGFAPRASAQASASVMPDVQLVYKRYWSQKVPSVNYFFYMGDTVTIADILTKLVGAAYANATVNDWPSFKPVGHTLTLNGQQVSVKSGADTTVSFSGNTSPMYKSTYEYGTDSSQEIGVSVQSKEIPPMLHAALTFSSTSDTSIASANVEASTPAVTFNAVTLMAAQANDPAAVTLTATGSVSPTSLAATSPTAVPVTGLYLTDINIGPSADGRTLYHAEVVDFSYFA